MSSIRPLATLQPTSNSRTWHSTPHPTLPILATACSDKTARIYSLQTLQQQSTISGGHKRSIRSCGWKPNSLGESVLVTGSFDASAGIWRRWEEGSVVGKARSEREAQEVDFTKGLAGGEEGEDEEEDEWRFAVILDGHDSEIKSVAFSPTSPLLATCSRDKSVWIWEELEDDNFETVAVLQDHEGDVKCVAWHPGEELLASGSYDDCIRLWREDMDDWACCALIQGHEGTVWWVEFEGGDRIGAPNPPPSPSAAQSALLSKREKSGPRLISCSDDLSIRMWHRVPKDKKEQPSLGTGRMPSIWKNSDFEEEWVEEARLPQAHERPVYAVSWSRVSGRVASTGSDGRIVVYEERWREEPDVEMVDGGAGVVNGDGSGEKRESKGLTEWVVLAEVENAHDVFEINHITWAPRADNGKRFEGEEVLVSTGDDGEVKVWTFDP